MQVSEAFFRYGKDLGAKCVPVYGGQPIFRQLQALDRGVHIVVGTPGRIIDHIGRGSLHLDAIKMVVLDEADEMLDMGFADDIESILEAIPHAHQTVLFSATMPPRINSIAKRYQTDPVRINVVRGDTKASAGKVRQSAYVVQRNHKPAALGRILDIESPGGALVFCRTRTEVDQLTETMNARGYRAEALHGGMDQAQRDRVHEPSPRRHRRTAGGHRRRRPRPRRRHAHPRRQLRRAVGPGELRAPHRPRRPRRSRRRRHHAGRAPRAAPAGKHRAAHQAGRSPSRRCRRSPTCAPRSSSRRWPPFASRWPPTTSTTSTRCSTRSRGEANPQTHRARRHPPVPRDGRQHRRRDRDPRHQPPHGAPSRGRRRSAVPAASRSRRRPRPVGDKGGTTGFVHIGAGPQAPASAPATSSAPSPTRPTSSAARSGPIKITEKFAIVGVPDRSVDKVIAALKQTTIKGKKPTVRRYTD